LKLRREHKIGILALSAIILFIWGFNYLKGRDVFTKENYFYGIYSQVSGLVEGSNVVISGLKVGRVEKIFFHDEKPDEIVVRFTVRKTINLPDNTIARIYSSDLLGTRAIELLLGKSSFLAEKGDTLKTEIQVSIGEEVSMQMLPFKKKAEDLMLSLDSVMAVVQYILNENTRENINKSFESIRQTIANLEHATFSLDTLMSEEKVRISNIFSNIESISLNIRRNNHNITNIIDNLSSITDTLVKADIINVISNTNKSMMEVSQIVEKINKGEGSLGMLINDDSLYNNLEKSSLELEKLLEDMRLNPNRYLHFSVFGRKNVPPAPQEKK